MRQLPEDWGVESVDPSQSSSASSFRRVAHKVNTNARCRWCLLLTAAFLAANVLFMLSGYDFVVNKVAVGQIVLQEGSGPKYEAWKKAPMPVYYKVTVFNLTNPLSFMKGDRPRLKECGPYTYRMLEKKLDIQFHENDTVTYRTQPTYLFERDMSGGNEDDDIWTVNIPLVNAADAVKSNSFLKTVIQMAQKIHRFKTLRQLTVKELLWGYQSHVMDWARTMQDIPYPHRQFGLLVGFNNTPQEPYTMYTGASNPDFMNTIYSWNGKTKLNFWSGDNCNEIKGTDASGFHPGVKITDKLYVFNGQLCRSLPLVFSKKVVHSGVETFRFVPPTDTFAYGPRYPNNSCFCGPKGCPLQGLLDMKPCYYGAAIAFSFPHFYQADPSLRHVVRGLRPDPELHGTQFDIYPALGVPVRVKLRMQMNVVIDGNQALQRDRHFDVVFPVFWFEAGIDSLPGEMVGMLKMAQDLPSLVKTTSVTICATLSAIFFILVIASAFAGYCGMTPESSRTQTPDHLPDTHWPANHPHPILNSSGYTAGSLASLGPDDSYRNVLPPYRKTFYQAEEIDGCPPSAYDTLQSEDRPPAYTSAQNTTKASSSSLLSVEIHKSASLHTLDAPSTPTDLLVDDFTLPDKNRDILDSKEKYFEAEKLQGSSPSSPTIKNEFVLSSSAKSSHIDLPMDDSINISNFNDDTANPLITSSPSDSPSIITPTSSSAPTILTEVNTSSVSAPAILSEANYFSSSTDLREIHFPNAPAILAEEDTVPCDSSRPPPLESDL